MGVIDSLNDTSNKAVDIGQVYYKKTQEYYKLKFFQQIAVTTGMLAKMLIVGSLVFVGLLFAMIAGTLFLGEVLGSMVISCLIMGSFLALIGFLLFIFRKHIDNLIVRKLSTKFFD